MIPLHIKPNSVILYDSLKKLENLAAKYVTACLCNVYFINPMIMIGEQFCTYGASCNGLERHLDCPTKGMMLLASRG